LGKIHDAAFRGGYAPRNGYGNLLVVSGIYNLNLGPQGEAGMVRRVFLGHDILRSWAFLMEIPQLRLAGADRDKDSGK
jgi:hypothetical protein